MPEKKILTLLTVFLLLAGVSCRQQHPETGIISGRFTDGAGSRLILQEMDTHRFIPLDSVTLDSEGRFSFTTPLKEAGFRVLKAPDGKIMVLLQHPGDHLELEGAFRDFPDHVTLKGPADAMLLEQFFRFTRVHERMVDSLELVLIENQDDPDYVKLTRVVDSAFRNIFERQREYEACFIDRNPGSLASLVVLNYAFGMSPVLGPEDDLVYYLKVDSALSKAYPGNRHVEFHHERLMRFLPKKP